MSTINDEIVWHNDGHTIMLELNRAEVKVLYVSCPEEGPCQHLTYGCMVRFFLSRFGLECNVGVAPPAEEMSIAWSMHGDSHDLEAAQIWIIPTSDEAFSAWLFTHESPEGQ